MRDPVVASDGHSYEREAIEEVIQGGAIRSDGPVSPLTREHIRPFVFANRNLRRRIDERQQEMLTMGRAAHRHGKAEAEREAAEREVAEREAHTEANNLDTVHPSGGKTSNKRRRCWTAIPESGGGGGSSSGSNNGGSSAASSGRCSSTACTLGAGHQGLCSHLRVEGKRRR